MNEYRLEANYANLLRKLERIPPELRRQFIEDNAKLVAELDI